MYEHELWAVWKHFSARREATLSSDSSIILEWTFDDQLTLICGYSYVKFILESIQYHILY